MDDSTQASIPPPPPSRLARGLRASAFVLPFCVALFFFSPGLSRLFAEVYGGFRDSKPLDTLLEGDKEETRITNRICRFRGTEWDTQIQMAKATPEELIEALDRRHAPADQKTADPLPAREALAGLRGAALAAAALSLEARPLACYSVDRDSIARVYARSSLVQRQPFLIALASGLGNGQSVLVTMKIRDPESIRNLAQPVDRAALRREVEMMTPLYPLSTVVDKVENETEDAVFTTYVVEQEGHSRETSDFYRDAVRGIETFSSEDIPESRQNPDSSSVFQSVERNGLRVDLIHLPGAQANRTTCLIKVRRAKAASISAKGF